MYKKDDIAKRRSKLSPEQLDLLEKRLRGEPPTQARQGPRAPDKEIFSGRRSAVVAIQPSGSKRPFFCVHPSNGSVLCYVDLARNLGPDQPFYGLQSPGLDSDLESFGSIESMAAHYVEAMRATQPQGPYLLGGWSMGGLVAYEMGRQLHARGEGVGLIALFDITPRARAEEPARERALESYNNSAEVEWFLKDLGRAFGKELPLSPADLTGLGPDAQVRYVLEKAKEANFLDDAELRQLHRLLKVFKENILAVVKYNPQACAKRVTVFRASEQLTPRAEDVEGGSITPDVELHVVEGRHFTILKEPYVKALAERLRACLDKA